ncbi:MAG: DUF2249 domain-containing protein [Betaproteobacteria bacterium]
MSIPVRLDMRGLDPPEPMERVLGALDTLRPGDQVLMIIDRQPRPLYRYLNDNGYAYRETLKPEGIFEILIWHAR